MSSRRTFLQQFLYTVFCLGSAAQVLSCGYSETPSTDSDSSSSGGNCLANGTNTAIGSNHSHQMTVSVEDITTGVEKTYAIQGSANHDHTVTLTEAHFSTLQSNQEVQLSSSSSSGHSHSITVTCA